MATAKEKFNSCGGADSNAKNIWNLLRACGISEVGAAGIMSNMLQESELNSKCVQGHYGRNNTFNLTYSNNLNNRTISKNTFKNTNNGYGLCQWTYSTRKKALYEQTVEKGKDISSAQNQIVFMVGEMKGSYGYTEFKVAWDYVKDGGKSTTPKQAAYNFHKYFEKSNDSENSSAMNIRKECAQMYYNAFAGSSIFNINLEQVNNVNTFLQIVEKEYNDNGNVTLSKNNKYTQYTKQGAVEWCTSFVAWCWGQAGINWSKPPYDFSCSKAYENYTTSSNEEVRKCWIEPINLQAGDALIYQWPGAKTTCSHIGIVVASQMQSDGKLNVSTIEGNVRGSKIKKYTNILINSNGISSNRNGNARVRGGIRLEGANAVGGSSSTVQGYVFSTFAKSIASAFSESIKNTFSGLSDGFSTLFKIGAAVSTKEIEYKEVNVKINKDIITSIDADANSIRTKGQNLLTTPTLVESPFVTLKVGDITLGTVYNSDPNNVMYPNFITGMTVVKVNGTVNQYTIQMVYQIEAGQDPNLIDKVFSKVGYGEVYITYGDYNAPAFIYRTEKAIITNLQSNVDFTHSRITYILSCTSDSLSLMGGNYSFPARNEAPSTIIYGMLYGKNSTYKLLDIFTGMKNRSLVVAKGLIPRDDAAVQLEAKQGMDALSYINYLTTCMSPLGNDSNSALKSANYYFTIHEDYDGTFGGPYFKITKVSANSNDLKTIAYNSSNTYEVDIGYPGDTLVTNFSLDNNNSWALLYNYSNSISLPSYSYSIDNAGRLIETSSPSIMLSSKYNKITETQRDWWTQMTRFPVQATLEIKGLIKPVLLMTYIRINALFYGQRHSSSGLYIVTKQSDRIDSRGYRTTLSLTRVAGDLDVIQTKSETVTTKVVVGYKSNGSNPELEQNQSKISEAWRKAAENTIKLTNKEFEERQTKLNKEQEEKAKKTADEVKDFGISLDKTSMICDVNGILWLVATVPDDIKDATITWSSSDTTIATVYNGKVTCLKPGSVNITAKSTLGKTAVCKVTVQQPKDGTVTLNKKEVECDIEGILWLEATVWGSDDNTVTWESTNTELATVVNGKVTCIKPGTVYIKAIAENENYDYCKVIIRNSYITLNKTSILYKQGDKTDIWLIPDYAPKTLTITWASSDSSIATAYNGHIEFADPYKVGTTNITATLSSGEVATCKVTTEYEVPATKIVLNKTSETVTIDGDDLWITATVSPKDATDNSVTWASSDTSIANVYNGRVEGIAPGKVYITATTYNGLTAKCAVTVKAK